MGHGGDLATAARGKHVRLLVLPEGSSPLAPGKGLGSVGHRSMARCPRRSSLGAMGLKK